MMKLLKWAIAIVVLLVAIVVLVGLFLPNTYHVERSVTIDAPPEVVFKYLNNLEEWEHWEPFSKADASIVTTHGDITSGVGANQSWTGDSGNGSLVFTMSDPEKGIAYDLQFDDYDPSTSQMTYAVVDGKTVLTWSMDGEVAVPVMGGYLVKMIEPMIATEYENGLRNIQQVAESDVVEGEVPAQP